jgi:DNA-binding winged helix-turn-helix (wHTH) protein/predicted ATPase
LIQFDRYRLDRAQGLWRGTQEVPVTPKSLALLCFLAERAGQVVSREEIFRAVWTGTVVGDSALTSCIQELRQALDDDPRKPRFIETLYRRGYRFIARNIPAVSKESQPAPSPRFGAGTVLVGRESILGQMFNAWELAGRGTRQVLFVTGEPGIGKTTLVHEFLAQLPERGALRATWGQCVQHYGAGEPYQPLLEGLMRLCRQPGGESVIRNLEQFSPTWLTQLPALVAPNRLAVLQRTVAGATRGRMLRELTDALEAIAADLPLVFWLEDLHWSDLSTVDWVAAFAQRPEPARVLIVGTFRPPAATGTNHPLTEITDSLGIKQFCREIQLGGLVEADVVEYAALRFPAEPQHTEDRNRLARMVRQRTGGNPLFVINVFTDFVARGILVEQDGLWAVDQDIDALDLGIPGDVRRTIEKQIEYLLPNEIALLEIASVAGGTFSAAAVARAAQTALNNVEAALSRLARQGRFVREAGVAEWPDGTVATRFAFFHILYRDVLYQRVPEGRRAELHRQIGALEEAAYGEKTSEIAAELAMHFERGHDAGKAGIYLQQAAENARQRSAFGEAKVHFQAALSLLEKEPPSRARTQREAVLRIGLGAALMATRGFGATGADEQYSRARMLCSEAGDTERLFPAIWGMWLFYWGRGPLSAAHELAQELFELAQRAGDGDLLLQARHAAWATAFPRGELNVTRLHATEGIRGYRTDRHAAMAPTYGSHDVGVCAHIFLARALALLGEPDAAIRTSNRAITLARELDQFSVALSHLFAAAVAQSLRDHERVRRHAAAAVAVAREQDFRLLLAWSTTFEGWAHVLQERREEGLAGIAHGLAEARAIRSDQTQSHFLGMLADAQLRCGQAAAGLQALDEAFAVAERTEERFWESELHRIRGELLLLLANPGAARDAEHAFLEAVKIAKAQEARLLGLRAAVSLGRLWRQLGRSAEARQIVTAAREEIAGGVALPDLTEATTLLSELEC